MTAPLSKRLPRYARLARKRLFSTETQRLRGKLSVFLLVGSLTTVAAYGLMFFGVAERMESRLWDMRVAVTADPTQADQSIKLIVIDQRSLDHFAEVEGYQWPWPRELYGYVIKFLERAGAKVLAFDMLYSESSFWGVNDDTAFAKDLETSLPIVMAAAALDDRRTASEARFKKFIEHHESWKERSPAVVRVLDQAPLPEFVSILLPVDELLAGHYALGNVTSQMDEDGVFRHTRLGVHVEGVTLLNLPFAAYSLVAPPENLAQFLSLVDERGRLSVKFYGAEQTYPHYSIVDVIKSEQFLRGDGGAMAVPLEAFKDAYVFLSVGAPGLFDSHPTPLSPSLLGVEFNANVLDNILHKNFIKKPGRLGNLLFVTVIAFCVSAAVFFISHLRLQFLVFALLGVSIVSFGILSAAYGYQFPLFVPLLVFTVTMLLCLAVQYYLEGRDHRFIKGAFGQYVSAEVIAQIVKDPTRLALGGDRRELTIFFSDIRGFTTISESLEASRLVQLLNSYLSEMTDIILDERGTLDKYGGDAIVCFWNAPLNVPDHATRAVRAALKCQERLAELRPLFMKEYGVEVFARIGIHTGVVGVGNFGSNKRFDYTVIGDAANLASRLEGANKYLGTSILLSQSTKDALSAAIPVRRVGEVQVVGRSQAVPVWEPVQESAWLRGFEEALDHFERGELESALAGFKQLAATDPVSSAYCNRIIEDRDRAPWSPVWKFDVK